VNRYRLILLATLALVGLSVALSWGSVGEAVGPKPERFPQKFTVNSHRTPRRAAVQLLSCRS